MQDCGCSLGCAGGAMLLWGPGNIPLALMGSATARGKCSLIWKSRSCFSRGLPNSLPSDKEALLLVPFWPVLITAKFLISRFLQCRLSHQNQTVSKLLNAWSVSVLFWSVDVSFSSFQRLQAASKYALINTTCTQIPQVCKHVISTL